MKHITLLTLIALGCFGGLNAQMRTPKSKSSLKERPPLQVQFGMLASAGLHQEYDRPDFVCFDCTPAQYVTSPRPNAVTLTGLTADFGRSNRHWGLRGTMAIGYQQFKWDYDVAFWPRGLSRREGTVHLRANNLIAELNLRLRYATLGKRPTILQVGAFVDGLLTRKQVSYFTTPNRSAYLSGKFPMAPAGVLVNVAQQIPIHRWVLEPFAEARYSLRYVMWDPNMASASLQVGLAAWLPRSHR